MSYNNWLNELDREQFEDHVAGQLEYDDSEDHEYGLLAFLFIISAVLAICAIIGAAQIVAYVATLL